MITQEMNMPDEIDVKVLRLKGALKLDWYQRFDVLFNGRILYEMVAVTGQSRAMVAISTVKAGKALFADLFDRLSGVHS